jgi:hypothetical protein
MLTLQEDFLLLCPFSFLQSTEPSAGCPPVLQGFIKEPNLFLHILSHLNNMGRTVRFVSFQSNAFELLARHSGSFEFLMDSGVVDRNKVICLEEVEQFIKEVVEICVKI